MHWFIGIFIGILICILGYLIYAYVCTLKQDDDGIDEPQMQVTDNQFTLHPVVNLQKPIPLPPSSQLLSSSLPPIPPSLPKRVQLAPSSSPSGSSSSSSSSKTWSMKDQEIRKKDNELDQDEIVDPPVPEVEMYNEIRTFEMSSLPYVASSLGIRNCVAVELVHAIIPKGEYTVSATENTMTIWATASPGTTYDITLAVGDYNITTLATEIQNKVRAVFTGTFTVTYISLTSTIRFSDAGGAFAGTMHPQLAYMLGFPSASFESSGGGNIVNGTNRVDLFGNRKVQVRTLELDGPDAHYNGILESIHLPNVLTEWTNTKPIELTERRFQHPRAIDQLTFSIKTRHPSQSTENDYLELALNGVEASLTICFRCLRYKNLTMDKALQLK